ncbi:hypothetical protein ACKWTF_015844 [Chironomus riparius]
MNYLQLFLILSSILFLSTNAVIKVSMSDKKFFQNICNIINDVTGSRTDTQDILIGNLGGKIWSSTVNDIAQCIDHGNAVVVTDFKTKITEKRLWKASVVVIAGLKQSEEVNLHFYHLNFFNQI